MRCCLCFIAVLVLATPPAVASEASVGDLVPRDSLGFVVFPDLGRSREALKGTTLNALFENTALRELLGDARQSRAFGRVEAWLKAELGLSFVDAGKLLCGELGLALVGVPEKGAPRLLIGLDVGKNLAAIQAMIAHASKRLRSDGGPAPTTTTHGGVKVTVVRSKSDKEPRLCYAVTSGRLLVSFHRAIIEGAIDRSAGGSQDTLTRHPGLIASRSAIGEPRGVQNLELFIDTEKLWRQLGKRIDEARGKLRATGLLDWRSVHYTHRTQGRQMVDVLHVRTPRRTGIARLIAPGAVGGSDALRRVPHDALGYAIARIDAPKQLAAALEIVAALDAKAHGELSKSAARLGLDTLSKTLGKTVVSHTVRPRIGLTPRHISQVELADWEAFLGAAARLARAASMELVHTEYKGRRIYHPRAVLGKPGRDRLLDRLVSVVPVHFYVDGKWAVLAASHQALLDHIDGLARQKPLVVRLPSGTAAFALTNDAPMLVGAYATLLPLIGAAESALRRAGVPLDTRHLPRPARLAKLLGQPSHLQLTVSDTGLTIRAKGDISAGLLAGTALFAAGALGMSRDASDANVGTAVGQHAPGFMLTAPDGSRISLSKLRGKVVVLCFWATWFSASRRAMPTLQKLHEAYGKEAVVLAVHTWGRNSAAADLKIAQAHMKENRYTCTLLMDAGDTTSDRYKIEALPTLFVIGPDGRVAHRRVGFDPRMGAKLGALIDGLLKPGRK